MPEDEIRDYLEQVARRRSAYDDPDYNAMDYSGHNFDDAFTNGVETDEIEFARELLTTFYNCRIETILLGESN